jgi:hypothetical protein
MVHAKDGYVKPENCHEIFCNQVQKNVEDIFPGPMLDELIAEGAIKQFFRPSEQKWIILGSDKTRGMGDSYEGKERRWTTPNTTIIKVTNQVPMNF